MEGLTAIDANDRKKLDALLGAGMAAYPNREASEADGRACFAQIRELSYDRGQESEADHIGVFLMTFAGYDPRQAVVFWEEMQRRSGSDAARNPLRSPERLARCAQNRVWAEKAHEAWLAWKAGRIEPAKRE